MKQVTIQIPIGAVKLAADVALPDNALGLVVFVSGSGSRRSSSMNRYVAAALNQGAFGTVSADLLTEEDVTDHQTAGLRYTAALSGLRLTAIVDWITQDPDFKTLGLGIFGVSTGAAAALVTAGDRPSVIQALAG